MSGMHSADDILINQITGTEPVPGPEVSRASNEEVSREQSAPSHDLSEPTPEPNRVGDTEPADATIAKSADGADDPGHDAYGNPKAKAEKLYTQDELNERLNQEIRRRIGEKRQEQPAQTQPQQQGDEQAAWEPQLEQFIDRTLSKREQQAHQQQAQQREAEAVAHFEAKIMSAMDRIPNFEQVVKGGPMTETMINACRGMEDPGGFIFAARSRANNELERISRISDPYAQAAEMGALESRMRQTARSTQASKPVSKSAGDSYDKNPNEVSIEDMIAQHAKRKFGR